MTCFSILTRTKVTQDLWTFHVKLFRPPWVTRAHPTLLAYGYAAWSLARLPQQYPCLSGRVCLKFTPACLAGGASLERSGSLARWSWSDNPYPIHENCENQQRDGVECLIHFLHTLHSIRGYGAQPRKIFLRFCTAQSCCAASSGW